MAYVKKITKDQFIRDVIDFELKPYTNLKRLMNLTHSENISMSIGKIVLLK